MFVYLIILLFLSFFQGILLWKGYQKAGYAWWQAFVPFYNMWLLLKIVERPWWWIFFTYLPMVGNLMLIVLIYEWLHTFGYRKKRYTLYSIVSLGGYLGYLMYLPQTAYQGKNELQIKENVSQWVNSTLFAVIAASAIHMCFVQPFIIPTSSLEKTLLVGDFLFVSKVNYGVRLPMTPMAAPMVHDTIPVVGVKSYIDKIQLPYLRLPALETIKRNDIVVFNWPTDTVRFFRDPSGIYAHKPIDKKSNYVKRAVAVAGDVFEIRQGDVYINGEKETYSVQTKLQSSYLVQVTDEFWQNITATFGVAYQPQELLPYYLYQRFGITDGTHLLDKDAFLVQSATAEVAALLRSTIGVKTVVQNLKEKGQYRSEIFPHTPHLPWNEDNIGPLTIPAQGQTINISLQNLPIYERIIRVYEGNTLEVKGADIYINGQKSNTYTFQQNYYWMMGDNRHNSEDSRFWGFVPSDHIVGKPLFIWMSLNNNESGLDKIRWERLFTPINGEGELVSYRYYVLFGGLIVWVLVELYNRKKRKTKQE